MRKVVRTVGIVLFVLALATTTIGAQGPAGSWVSGIQIVNLSQTETAHVTVKFYNLDDGTAGSGDEVWSFNVDIPPKGSVPYYVPNDIPQLPQGFIGSAVISSDVPVAANLNTELDAGTRKGTASGVSEPSDKLYFTQVMKNYWGFNSYIAVQNTTDTEASVNCKIYATDGTLTLTEPATIKPYSSHIFYQASQALPGSPPSGFGGSAVVESTGAGLAGIVNYYKDGSTAKTSQFKSYNAFSGGSQKLYVPRLLRLPFYGPYAGGLAIQNVGTGDTTVTIDYYFGGVKYTQSSTLGARQPWPLYLPDPAQVPVLDGVTGSGAAIITSSSQPIVATVNEDNDNIGYGVTYNAILDTAATTQCLLPQIVSKFWGNCGGLQIMNVGTVNANMTATFSMQGRADVTLADTIEPNGVWELFAPDALASQGASDLDWNGSVLVTSNTKIVGIGNMSYRFDKDPRYGQVNGDTGTCYNAINVD
jgi:hypothetical protein